MRYAALVDVAFAADAADVDNLAKSVADGLQGAAIPDDRRIDLLWASKRPATPGAPPGARVTLWALGPTT